MEVLSLIYCADGRHTEFIKTTGEHRKSFMFVLTDKKTN